MDYFNTVNEILSRYNISTFDLFVFNRWGEVIWESHDAKAKWDGTYGSEGMQCPQGVYTWKIAYKPAENDDKISLTGHITLIR
jgi:gliding motility-associated-like protein